MSNQGFWHPDRGYWETTGQPKREIWIQYPEGTIEVPVRPNPWYDWDCSHWVLNETREAEVLSIQVRAQRDKLLKDQVDPLVTNSLRWTDLTQAEKDALTQYRRDLLDITDQPGFPRMVTWPTYPL